MRLLPSLSSSSLITTTTNTSSLAIHNNKDTHRSTLVPSATTAHDKGIGTVMDSLWSLFKSPPLPSSSSLSPPPLYHPTSTDSRLPLDTNNHVSCLATNSDTLYVGTHASVLEYNTLSHSTLRSFVTTGANVSSLASSARRLFSGYEDGSIRVWSLSSGACARSVIGHKGPVLALCFTPEGKLYSGGQDGGVSEWDARSCRRRWMLRGHSGSVTALCADGKRLYSSGADRTVRVWDMSTGRCIVAYQEHQSQVLTLCLGRDLLYSAAYDGTIHVLDIGTGQTLRTLKGHTSPVHSLVLSKGKLYSAGDASVLEWDVKAGRVTRAFEVEQKVVALVAGRGRLVTACVDGEVKVWDVDDLGSGTSSPTGSAPPSPPQSPTPADEPDTPDIHPTDSASNAPNGTESILTSHESEAHPTAASDDIRVLKLQLAQAQELVAKQNRQKLRLKSELVAARTELAHIKADMSMAQESVARAAEAEEELAAAKELLVTYKTELNVTQEAHEAAFEYLKRSADRNWIEIEKEISGLYAMLQNPFTPLFVKDDLEGFMPPRQVPRCWDTDSEFDSDVEVDESLAWWRRDAPVEGVKRDPAKLQWWRPDADHPDESEEVESASVSSNESGIPSDVVAHSVVVKAHRKLSDGAVMITDSPSPPLDTPRKRTNSWFRPIQTWVEHLNDIVEDRPVVRVRSRDVYRFDEDLRVDVSGYRGGHPDSAVEVDNVEGPLEKMARGFEGVLEGVVGFGIFKK